MDFKKFFAFKDGDDVLFMYLIFFNQDTGNYEIVSRSGDVVCIIPPIKGMSGRVHKQLALLILSDFQDGIMFEIDSGYPFLDRLLCMDEVLRCLRQDEGLSYFDYRKLKPIPYRSSINNKQKEVCHVY
ncbi:MAG: hypothetical protein PHE96_11300 [Methylococcales bacterium]|nr:hypothetical protein [Methylococcales bacterium]